MNVPNLEGESLDNDNDNALKQLASVGGGWAERRAIISEEMFKTSVLLAHFCRYNGCHAPYQQTIMLSHYLDEDGRFPPKGECH